MTLLSDLLSIEGVVAVKPFESRHGSVNLPQPDRIVGLELEIEGFNPEATQKFPGFRFEADGSLRSTDGGIGIEAITLPIKIQHVPGLLEQFYRKFEITERNYSERCSTHVHVNVMDLTVEQMASLGLLYQTTERLLFEFVHPDRKNSIFCVPWYQSGLTYNYVSHMLKEPGVMRRWQKYSALNLLPVYQQGSIEFRHLEGTCDIGKIKVWLAFIGKLFERAQSKSFLENELDICKMNTVSNYREWLSSLFGEYCEHFLSLPSYEQALFRGVVDSKYMLSSPSKSSKNNNLFEPEGMTGTLGSFWGTFPIAAEQNVNPGRDRLLVERERIVNQVARLRDVQLRQGIATLRRPVSPFDADDDNQF